MSARYNPGIERFVWQEGEVELSQCLRCRWLMHSARCTAFLDGIPMPIWLGKNNHRQPYPGDNGIRFEPIEEPTAS